MDRQTGNKTDERQSIKLCTGNNDGNEKKKNNVSRNLMVEKIRKFVYCYAIAVNFRQSSLD